MSRSDESVKKLLEQIKEHDEMYTIVNNNKVLAEYSGKELDDMEDIPGWEYIMKVAEKLYDEFETKFGVLADRALTTTTERMQV